MKNAKHFIALFYVTLILLFKVAGLHSLTHHTDDTDIQHCEVCHITTAVNFTPLVEVETSAILKVVFYVVPAKVNTLTSIEAYNDRFLSSYLFTRPPPQSV
ncbi:hypothetical protein [Maribacter sp.]|uniref:hypothetical protein n=1 Tax=Maribacter sp. TaxID=1897614 RepID=UPI0025C6C8C3|nr:hypothetical protein [Maribacter sp.]